MAHSKPQPIPIESQQAGHELRDTPAGPIIITAISIVATLVVAIVAVVVLLSYFNAELEKEHAAVSVPQVESIQVIPDIHLQVNPERDLAVKMAHDEGILSTYGWVDKGAGIVHIPIDVAMDEALEEGFPTSQ